MSDILTLELISEHNKTVALNDILAQQTTLVVLLRQGECIECVMMVDKLQTIYTNLYSLGVPIVFIGNGSPSSLPGLRKRLAISDSVPLYTDPTLKIYSELGLHTSLMRTFGPKGMFNIANGWLKGFTQTRWGEHQGQQSGLVLLDSNKQVRWLHISKYLGDLPKVGDILEQVLLLKVDGGEV